MKVYLERSVDNDIYPGENHDMLILSSMTRALTTCFLPKWGWSPLKEMIINRTKTARPMILYLKVTCADNSKLVISIKLCCDLLDDLDRTGGSFMEPDIHMAWKEIDECIKEYFKSIGYDKLECTNDEDILNFVKRLYQDIPLVMNYFSIR